VGLYMWLSGAVGDQEEVYKVGGGWGVGRGWLSGAAGGSREEEGAQGWMSVESRQLVSGEEVDVRSSPAVPTIHSSSLPPCEIRSDWWHILNLVRKGA